MCIRDRVRVTRVDDGDFDLCLSFGSRSENVYKRRAAGNRRPIQRDALKLDGRRGDLRLAVLLWADCSKGYLYLLTYGSGQMLPVVGEVERQDLPRGIQRGRIDCLSITFAADCQQLPRSSPSRQLPNGPDTATARSLGDGTLAPFICRPYPGEPTIKSR